MPTNHGERDAGVESAKHFHNTIGLEGETLQAAILRAKNQEVAVLAIFQRGAMPLSGSQVLACTQAAGRTWPITSIRRAIHELVDANALVKLEHKRIGPHGMPEFFYALPERGQTTGEGEPSPVMVRAA